ncbi:hypothetical protein AAC387_Pa03g2283 [Persea americana]
MNNPPPPKKPTMPTLESLFSNEPSSPKATKPTMPTLKSLFSNDPLPSPPKATKPTIYLNFFKSIFTSSNQSPPPKSWTAITDFMNIITTNSKSAFQIFRHDMKEFGSDLKIIGSDLKKDMVVIRDIASRSVRDLDGFGSSIRSATAEIISHGREAIFSPDSDREDYRALETRDFEEWKLGFRIEEKGEEIESFCGRNSVVEDFYRAFVPDVVDHETFWTRYFYRIHKDEADDARSDLLKRAALEDGREEEDLKQELDGDDVEAKDEILEIGQVLKTEIGDDVNLTVEERAGSDCCESNNDLELNERPDEKLVAEGKKEEVDGLSERTDEKLVAEGKEEEVDGLREKKNSDEDDDELGWVEIENFGDEEGRDESCSCDSLNRSDDDMSWEIEDYEPDME